RRRKAPHQLLLAERSFPEFGHEILRGSSALELSVVAGLEHALEALEPWELAEQQDPADHEKAQDLQEREAEHHRHQTHDGRRFAQGDAQDERRLRALAECPSHLIRRSEPAPAAWRVVEYALR